MAYSAFSLLLTKAFRKVVAFAPGFLFETIRLTVFFRIVVTVFSYSKVASVASLCRISDVSNDPHNSPASLMLSYIDLNYAL
jgi:hypothetical protein